MDKRKHHMEKFVLTTPRLPARLDAGQVADRLGFQEYEVGILMRLGLLKPLGTPAQNGHKWFATVTIEQNAQDHTWLDKATKAVARHIKSKTKKASSPDGSLSVEA